MGELCERSSAMIELQDLLRLSEIAHWDLERYIAGDPDARATFASKILCVALCQGAALHYLDKTTGVKDFDIFTFFVADGMKKFPPRRRTSYDFGRSKFGRHPDDVGYTGRRVDVMGRSIFYAAGALPFEFFAPVSANHANAHRLVSRTEDCGHHRSHRAAGPSGLALTLL